MCISWRFIHRMGIKFGDFKSYVLTEKQKHEVYVFGFILSATDLPQLPIDFFG